MRKYILWSLQYRAASSGQKTMHLLCHELNRAGQRAAVRFPKRNRVWRTPYHAGPIDDSWIAVYPEIIEGNPLGARHVVRWMLNKPLDRQYEPLGVRFSFHRLFDPSPLLHLPAIELDLYKDRHLPRTLTTYWVGKETKRLDLPGAIPIDNSDQARLADTLNRSKVMYAFDTVSAMNEIARLCGCPVIFVPGGRLTREEFDEHVVGPGFGWDAMPEPFDAQWPAQRQRDLKAAFRRQLADFISITQATA